MVIGAILGGGSGARMGGDLPKQFLQLGGEAVILRSLRAFLGEGLADACLLLVPAAYVVYTEELVRAAGLYGDKPVAVLPGGETRSDTLLKALEYARQTWGLNENVIVTHDAARPFVTRRMIEQNIAGALRWGAVNTCMPATDTVFLSEDGSFISAVPPRSTVFHAQTPQSFRAQELYDLICAMPPADFAALTDGCSVFTFCGKPVYMVEGSADNIKITYPGDLDRARQILARLGEK